MKLQDKIAHQLDVSDGGTTDATAISVATRYIHSPVEVLSLEDMESCADLIAHAVRAAGKWF